MVPEIVAKNVNSLFPFLLKHFATNHSEKEYMGGKVLESNTPYELTITKPLERIFFFTGVRTNPFYALMKSIFLLSDNYDMKHLAQYNALDSDLQTISHRHSWNYKIQQVQESSGPLLRDISLDIEETGVYECGFQMTMPRPDQIITKSYLQRLLGMRFTKRDGMLDLHVFLSQTSLLDGLCCFEQVYFSYLLEYVSSMSMYKVGKVHINCNRVYMPATDYETKLLDLVDDVNNMVMDFYNMHDFPHFPLVKEPDTFCKECSMMFKQSVPMGFTEPFFKRVYIPAKEFARVHDGMNLPDNLPDINKKLAKVKDKGWLTIGISWLEACMDSQL